MLARPQFSGVATRLAPSLASLLAALALLGCSARNQRETPAPVDLDASMPAAKTSLGPPQRTAVVNLRPVAGSSPAVQGSARFVSTATTVDLRIESNGCDSSQAYPVRVLDGDACGATRLSDPAWDPPRGEGIPNLQCTGVASGIGRVAHGRARAQPERSWSIGTGDDSDLLGRALALFDPTTGVQLACGVIEAAADRTPALLPPPEEGPPLAVRALLAGSCLSRTLVPSGVDACPDPEALVACSAEHCAFGDCLEACDDYSACLSDLDDPCDGVVSCPLTDDCIKCQGDLLECTLSFCTSAYACITVTPGGPCSRLEACCTLQGDDAGDCLTLVQSLSTLGGDPSCLSATMDWDVIAHLNVPCPFGD